MKKIGVSLPWDYLTGKNADSGSRILYEKESVPDRFLKDLKTAGTSSIELRHRQAGMKEKDMDLAFRRIEDAGLEFTIHSDDPPGENDWKIEQALPWVSVLEKRTISSGSPITVTLHPVIRKAEDEEPEELTARYVHKLWTEISSAGLPLRLALENQRSKGKDDPGTSFTGVTRCLKLAFPSELPSEMGICWDMGHCTANHITDPVSFPLFPDDDFLSKTIHTHIHDLGPAGDTHWPILENKVPVEEFTEKLASKGYKGILNLELSFSRFSGHPEFRALILKSIGKLAGITG